MLAARGMHLKLPTFLSSRLFNPPRDPREKNETNHRRH